MRVQFILSELWQGLRRNVSMTVAVVLVTFVSLTFVGAAVLLQTQIDKFKGQWYDQVEVSVYLCPQGSLEPTCASGEATQDQIDSIQEVLESPELASEISSVTFESKDQAWEAFQERYAGQWVLSVTTVDDMSASFRIKLVDPEHYQVIDDVLAGRPGVEKISDERQVLEPIFRVLRMASYVSAGLAAVMLVAAVLLITTTIRLSALSRRRETGIMRLVGASSLFIQLPFMLEGAFAALIGGLLAAGALWFAVDYLVVDWMTSSGTLQWVPYVTTSDVASIAPWLVLLAVALAALASAVTLRRYTKV